VSVVRIGLVIDKREQNKKAMGSSRRALCSLLVLAIERDTIDAWRFLVHRRLLPPPGGADA
jgi:hypothetical protein